MCALVNHGKSSLIQQTVFCGYMCVSIKTIHVPFFYAHLSTFVACFAIKVAQK